MRALAQHRRTLMGAVYDYLQVALARGGWPDFTRHVRAQAAAVRERGGEIVGLFQGQLGFASDEAIVLLRWKDTRGTHDLDGAPGVVAVEAQALTPTVRPAEGKALKSGGIYVHRWFTADGARVDDFIALSNRAWANFEGSYDTEIFGLFTAEPNAADRKAGAGRLLLLTWYASHGVWEASRDQTRDPEGLFVKRHALTRTTIGKSSLSVPLEL